jgi:hypothetical protein
MSGSAQLQPVAARVSSADLWHAHAVLLPVSTQQLPGYTYSVYLLKPCMHVFLESDDAAGTAEPSTVACRQARPSGRQARFATLGGCRTGAYIRYGIIAC